MRNSWKNLLLLMGSVLFTLVALEGVARLGSFFFTLRTGNHHSLFCEHDPLLGWRHKSNWTSTFVQSEYETTLHFNTRGIRGPEYSIAKAVDEYRIVILGDSFAEGYTVEFEELFSEVLKQRLVEQTGRYIEVINFGVGGYSTDQELLLYQKECKRYQPDLTILMFHDNDVWYNTQARYGPWGRGYKPVFRINEKDLLLTNVPVPLPDPPPPVPDPLVDSSPASFFNRIKHVLSDRSYLYRWVRRQIKNTPRLYSLAIALKIADPQHNEKRRLVPKEYEIYTQIYAPEITAAWQMTEALLTKFKEEADAVGSELLVFYVPMRAVVYTEEWEKMKKYYAMTDSEWSIDRLGQELHDILERHEIEFLNPVSDMRKQAENLALYGDRIYFKGDGHWNGKGHHLAGEILAKYILAHYPVKMQTAQ